MASTEYSNTAIKPASKDRAFSFLWTRNFPLLYTWTDISIYIYTSTVYSIPTEVLQKLPGLVATICSLASLYWSKLSFMDPPKREAKPSRRKGPSAQERRREEVLRAQKESRRSALYRARDLIEDADQREDRRGEDYEKSGNLLLSSSQGGTFDGSGQIDGSAESRSKGWRQAKRSSRVLERRIFWASSVTTPEWMVSKE